MQSVREQALALHQQQNYVEAEKRYLEVLKETPQDADVLHMLGVLKLQTAVPDQALVFINQALAIDPSFVGAKVSQVRALSLLGRHDEVIELTAKALTLELASRQKFQLLAAKGQAELLLGNYTNAKSSLVQACALNPEDGFSQLNLAITLHQLGELALAENSYSKAALLMPQNAWAPFNHALLKQEQFEFEQALALLDKALRLNPDNLSAMYQQAYLFSLTCNWQALEQLMPSLTEKLIAFEQSDEPLLLAPYILNVLPLEQSLISKLTKRYAKQISASFADKAFISKDSAKARDKDKPLTIGYLSPDYRQHAVGMLIADLFDAHSSDVEVYIYALKDHAQDDVSNRVKNSSHATYRDLTGLGIHDAAHTIHQDNLDVLVDLAGYTLGCRSEILALRPAPIQVSWLGYLNTMGADYIDYIIADKQVLPETLATDYQEKPLYLERCMFPVSSTLAPAELPTKTQLNLPEDAFIFACFNNSYKIDRQVMATWLSILESVPNSVLWLYQGRCEAVAGQLEQAFEAAGIARERLIFAETVTLDQHLARLQHVDLFLDTFNYNAGATAITALLAGVPLLTLKGEKLLQRLGYSFNRSLGLEELVANDIDEYRELAIELAQNADKLSVLKEYLKTQAQAHSLFDIKDMASHLERSFTQLVFK
jgi:protein O-GlcNAc transferase